MKRKYGLIGFAALCCAMIFGFQLSDSSGQDVEEREDIADSPSFKIRLTVEEVQLDAVVLDWRGRPVTDLTLEDFKVYQDNEPQKIRAVTWVDETPEAAPRPATVAQADAPPAPGEKKNPLLSPLLAMARFAEFYRNSLSFSLEDRDYGEFLKTEMSPLALPVPELKREDVRRSIVFVVDDRSMGFEALYYTKMGLARFVEKQMLPGDLVAILQTSDHSRELDLFLSDKRALWSRINSLSWGSGAGFTLNDGEYQSRQLDPQLASLSSGVRALKDMPGRKFLLMFSSQPDVVVNMYETVDDLFASRGDDVNNGRSLNYYDTQGNLFNRLADEALRAGVVVHTLDTRGLTTEFSAGYQSCVDSWRYVRNPMPQKTGGSYIENSNFFLEGIGKEVENMMRGYYLISYIPSTSTFKDGQDVYHHVKIRVKRKWVRVHTRDGFFGQEEPEPNREEQSSSDLLRSAMLSSFASRGLGVNLATGYIDVAKAGYLIRSWLHLNANDVTIGEDGDGGVIKLNVLCLTSDRNALLREVNAVQYDLRVKQENLAWIREHGIRFSVIIPVRQPGFYNIRAVVQDRESGRVGSAQRHVEIPDLKKKKELALSDIFVIDSTEGEAWLRPDAANGEKQRLEVRRESRNPALREYAPGDQLRFMAVLYNAATATKDKAAVETQSVLYRNGMEVFRGPWRPVALTGQSNANRIPLAFDITLGRDLAPGDYVLQFVAANKKKTDKKGGIAAETLNFRITGRPTDVPSDVP